MITLNANTFIGTLTNLIAYQRAFSTQDTRGLDRLLERFRGPLVPNGDGIVIRSTGIPSVTNLDTSNSTVLSVVKPVIKEQYIPVKAWKKIQVTINEYLMRGGFTRENAMAELIGLVLASMYTAEKAYLYNMVEEDILSNVDTLLSSTPPTGLTISFNKQLTGLKGVTTGTTPDSAEELLAKRTYNTKLLVRTLISTIKQIERGKFNGLSGVKTYVGRDRLVAIMSDSLLASLDVDLMATLLNSEYLNNKISLDIITIDSVTGTNINNGTVILMQKDSYIYGYFYQVATSFFDASNLNLNQFLHFSHYNGMVNASVVGVINLSNFEE